MIFEIPEIQRIEERLETLRNVSGCPEYLERLELLADLYLKQDGYEPAIEYLEEILSETNRLQISGRKRILLEMKVIECLLKRSRCGEALAKCEQISQELEDLHDDELVAQLNLLRSQVYWKTCDYPNSLSACKVAVRIFTELKNERGMAECHSSFGRSYLRLGQFATAREHFEEALSSYRRLQDKAGIAVCHNNLGLMHKNRSEWQLAFDHLLKALELDKESGNYGKVALRLLNLGLVHYKIGQWMRARESMEEALAISTRIGDQHTCAAASIGLGNCLRLLGDLGGAEKLYKRASSIAKREKLFRELALAHEFSGEGEFTQRNFQPALKELDSALAIAGEIAPEGDIVAEVERRRAEVFLELGEIKTALKTSRRSLALCRLLGDKHEEGAALSVIARARARLGCSRSAVVAFRGSVRCLESVSDRYGLACTLLHFGRFMRSAALPSIKGRHARLILTRAAALFAELGAESLLRDTEKELECAWADDDSASAMQDAAWMPAQETSLLDGFITRDTALIGVLHLAEQLSKTDARVLIQGETGVGKNLLAYIFRTHEESKGRPFIELNCATIPAELLESELFGYAKGAFSGASSDKKGILEEANGGTLFLNEIAEMEPKMQAKLLQFLDDGSYRRVGDTRLRTIQVRFICATNKDLWQQVEKGKFRCDLYFRLSQSVLSITPLRERINDVPVLVDRFVRGYCQLYSKRLTLEPCAMEMMQRHSWPGNVRELKSKIQRLVMESPSIARVTAKDVDRVLGTPEKQTEPRTLSDKIESLKKAEIARALARFGGNKTKAARALGISRRGLVKVVERMDTVGK